VGNTTHYKIFEDHPKITTLENSIQNLCQSICRPLPGYKGQKEFKKKEKRDK
jgi:hypothetical protein